MKTKINLFASLLGRVEPRGFYRPDIDGLRAVAVLAVLVYHYAPTKFPGGFIGVDVFFVISGYLITGILAKAIDERKFTSFPQLLSDFYQRRIRRIFPPLILVLALCLVVGWVALFPAQFQKLGKHVAASAGYVENFILWLESGYFDRNAIFKPLLHLWSLAVEEQFYIVWPFLLWIITRRRWPVMAAITLIAGLSFALNAWQVLQGYTAHAFYFPTTRMWELMVGAWLAMGHRRGLPWLGWWKALQSWLGLALIVAGFSLITPNRGFPGFWALLPVLGTALMINGGMEVALNKFVLSWKPAVWVGLISYSLYLWHWALYSLSIVAMGRNAVLPLGERKLALAFISLLLAWLTYRYFEQPVRRSRKLTTSVFLFVAVALLGFGGLSVYLMQGFENRPLTAITQQAKISAYTESLAMPGRRSECTNLHRQPGWPKDWYCVLGDKNADLWIAAYGDSHAMSMIAALNRYGKEAKVRIILSAQGGCISLKGTYREYPESKKARACKTIGDKMAALVKEQHAAAVVLIENWTHYTGHDNFRGTPDLRVIKPAGNSSTKTDIRQRAALKHGLRKTLAYYQSLHVPVILTGADPKQNQTPMAALHDAHAPTDREINQHAVTVSENRQSLSAKRKILHEILKHFPSTTVFSMSKAVCGSAVCPLAKNGKFLYHDTGHLSVAGTMVIYPLLARHLNRVLAQHRDTDPG